jgi:D-hydroxyproline dehydrogenase subunit beta
MHDVLVVGSGIVGLAHALSAARRGKSVVVVERSLHPVGASIRNFGLIWPIGQPLGRRFDRALRSRSIWTELAEQTGMYFAQTGSLHVVHREDEYRVIEEFVELYSSANLDVQLLSANKTIEKAPAVRRDNLRGSMWSPFEVNVDPRQAIPRIVDCLKSLYNVEFRFGVNAVAIEDGVLFCADQIIEFDRAYVCSGQDFEILMPQVQQESELIRVKLQMMRSTALPMDWDLGPALCAGLTLLHYDAFSDLNSLEDLRVRVSNERPEYVAHGIHVLLSQNSTRQLIMGDTHEYGHTLDPFVRSDLNDLVTQEIARFVDLPPISIDESWIGIYAKCISRSEFVSMVSDQITVVNGLGGAGMTLSFGLAEEVIGGTYQAA